MIACPTCGKPTTVAETRSVDHYVRRRRHCPSLSCGTRVTTAEIVVATDDALNRPLGDVMIVSRRDIEEIMITMAEALATRLGSKAVVDIVGRVLQGQTTTGGQDGNDHGRKSG